MDRQLLPLKAIAQLHQTYIVAEHPDGLWLVEQHIAHERVLYEQITDDWQLVPLPTPLLLSNLSEPQIQQLENIGIDVEPFGINTWAVRQVPKLLVSPHDRFCRDTQDVLPQTLLELSSGVDLNAAQVAVSCRCAIRNGTPLTLEEMQNLLDSWQITRNPHTCPHGRPIYLSLSNPSLGRFFRRHWVIGKSHGI
jgi:DNA mismatch repair protein MutL